MKFAIDKLAKLEGIYSVFKISEVAPTSQTQKLLELQTLKCCSCLISPATVNSVSGHGVDAREDRTHVTIIIHFKTLEENMYSSATLAIVKATKVSLEAYFF